MIYLTYMYILQFFLFFNEKLSDSLWWSHEIKESKLKIKKFAHSVKHSRLRHCLWNEFKSVNHYTTRLYKDLCML